MKHNFNDANTIYWSFNGILALCISPFKLIKLFANAVREYVLVLAEDGYK